MAGRIFGHISEYPIGTTFESRQKLAQSGIHRPLQSGISGSGNEGADSIVLSGGYEDDKDDGDVIIYTGQGGRDPGSGKQIESQELTRGNLALAVSELHGLPVRVIRGAGHKSFDSPKTGYRYDGLYRIEDHWRELGKSGFYVWRFRLVRISEDDVPLTKPDILAESKTSYAKPERKASSILRIVRDTKQSRRVKEIYEFHCQICGTRLETAAGSYAEAAHVKPLGQPHNGPDTLDNLLCLCPNHHVLFDLGAFSIADDFTLVGINGKLKINSNHKIKPEYLRYHREHYLNTAD